MRYILLVILMSVAMSGSGQAEVHSGRYFRAYLDRLDGIRLKYRPLAVFSIDARDSTITVIMIGDSVVYRTHLHVQVPGRTTYVVTDQKFYVGAITITNNSINIELISRLFIDGRREEEYEIDFPDD